MGWKFPGVDKGDGDGINAFGFCGFERGEGGLFVEGCDFLAVDVDAAGDFRDAVVEHGGEFDVEVEEFGAGLVADAQQIGKTAVDEEEGFGAFALQQGVGGDGGAHADGVDGRVAGQGRDTGEGGVLVVVRVFGEEFFGAEVAGGITRDNIGECAAAVDPEMPAHAPCRPKMMAVDV